MWCNYSKVAFPEVKECEHKASWACPVFKINCVKHGTGGKEQTGLYGFFFSPPLGCLQCHQRTSYNLSSPMTCVQLQGTATAENNRNAAAQVTFLSPPHFKILLFQKGKQWLVLVALHHSASLLKFTIIKVQRHQGWADSWRLRSQGSWSGKPPLPVGNWLKKFLLSPFQPLPSHPHAAAHAPLSCAKAAAMQTVLQTGSVQWSRFKNKPFLLLFFSLNHVNNPLCSPATQAVALLNGGARETRCWEGKLWLRNCFMEVQSRSPVRFL